MAMTSDSPGLEPDPPRVSTELPRIVPVPDIPAALRGCWDAIPPADPDEPGGPHRLVITANTVAISGPGTAPQVASTEYVNTVSPTSIEGMFSSRDDYGRSTVATALMLDEGSPENLIRREGDAGSSEYERCK